MAELVPIFARRRGLGLAQRDLDRQPVGVRKRISFVQERFVIIETRELELEIAAMSQRARPPRNPLIVCVGLDRKRAIAVGHNPADLHADWLVRAAVLRLFIARDRRDHRDSRYGKFAAFKRYRTANREL